MIPGSQVPTDWVRSRSEQYFILVSALRRADPTSPTRQTFVDGIKAIGATTHGPLMKKRCQIVVETEQKRAA